MKLNDKEVKNFQEIIWGFYKNHKRDLPWRPPLLKVLNDGFLDAYKIVVSEIMLQQTQVPRVIEKYYEFIKKFPTFEALSQASIADVLSAWQGLGYNRRALFLKRTAQEILKKQKEPKLQTGNNRSDVSIHHYMIPEFLETLPGIGKNTARSIYVFAFNKPEVFIETNIRRVFIHEFYSHSYTLDPEPSTLSKIHDNQLYPLIEQTLDRTNPREWYYALMDYGSHLPKIVTNPNRQSKHYTKQSKFEGSLRQVRGRILKILLNKKSLSIEELKKEVKTSEEYFENALAQLLKEQFLKAENNKIKIRK